MALFFNGILYFRYKDGTEKPYNLQAYNTKLNAKNTGVMQT
jgi:hypothetical protein